MDPGVDVGRAAEVPEHRRTLDLPDIPNAVVSDVVVFEVSEVEFLEAILLELRNAKILHSKKGKGGGYYLYKKPEDVNLIDVVRLMDGAVAMLPCVSLNYYEPCEECRDEKTCGIRDAFVGVRDETLKILTDTSLAKIVKRQQEMGRRIILAKD